MAQLQLTPYVTSTIQGLDANARSVLEAKLKSIITANGMECAYDSRFLLAVNIGFLDREVLATAPVQIVQNINVSLAIGDGATNKVFGTASVEVKGVGTTDERACLQCIKSIKAKGTKVGQMISDAKDAIINYYETEAPRIIAEAKGLEAVQKYDEALYEISLIPQECSKYDEAVELMLSIYQSQIDIEATGLLSQAKAKWAESQTTENAKSVLSILATINPAATCIPEVEKLVETISAKCEEIALRDYNDKKEKDKMEFELTKLKINAAKEKAIAYAQNQPKTVYAGSLFGL